MHTMKKIAAAVTIVLAAGTAQAAIVDGLTGPSELFVNVWDATAQTSYHLDLGVTTNDLVNNPSTEYAFNLAADANYAAFLGTSNTLVYSVSGFNNVLNDVPDLPYYGAFITSNDDVVANVTNNDSFGQTQVGNVGTKISVHLTALNAVDITGLDNGSGVSTPADGAAYFGDATWLTDFGGAIPFSNAAQVGTGVNFWHLATTDGLDGVATMFDKGWLLGNDGTLVYTPVSTIPVPAAVWLFVSGLLGLVGVARRKAA